MIPKSRDNTCGKCAYSYMSKGVCLCDLDGKRIDPGAKMCRKGDGSASPSTYGSMPDPQASADMQYHGCMVDNMDHR